MTIFHTPISKALPFWISLGAIPCAILGAVLGGWWWLTLPLYSWYFVGALDLVLGKDTTDFDPETDETDLYWYRFITMAWFPIQFVLIYGMIWYVTRSDHLSFLEMLGVFFAIGISSGTTGIVYSHELMHQKNRAERWLADLLLATTLYSHFRSEHLLVHHPYVGTPRDPVTARYNEDFYHYFIRVLRECPKSAWRAEAALLARRDLPMAHPRNPFWKYAILQATCMFLALWIGGWLGLVLFIWQAFIAIIQLEITNYVEHYGLTREHLGDGHYEHVKPHHSWNAAHKATNWLLINLQRHSDHHYKPSRRFPLLQNHDEDQAPQLPFGYTFMGVSALIPPMWRRRMNPRVRAWRKKYYPHITDWSAYKTAKNPMPKNAS
ncbi:MAG: alkane 1-monooxygenase [Halocynthiibacter sp.]